MRAVCADFETELVEFNGERGHVHLLAHYRRRVSISQLVGSLKGISRARAPGSTLDPAEPLPGGAGVRDQLRIDCGVD
ncbi:transposase IS200 family protein [Kribbella sp. VKM Ac-2571]|nr:transposase IS200 family protein [Kribbella sp. VKM Ac-2571]